jgi:hypothetical protein
MPCVPFLQVYPEGPNQLYRFLSFSPYFL